MHRALSYIVSSDIKITCFFLVFTTSAVNSQTSLILRNALISADCLVLHFVRPGKLQCLTPHIYDTGNATCSALYEKKSLFLILMNFVKICYIWEQTWALGVMESASSRITSLKAGHGLPLQTNIIKKQLSRHKS